MKGILIFGVGCLVGGVIAHAYVRWQMAKELAETMEYLKQAAPGDCGFLEGICQELTA